MQQITVRLKPGQLLKEEIERIAVERNIKAGVLLAIVAGLENAILRMAGSDADSQDVRKWEGPFEVVAGTGTISKEGCHIHVAVSEKGGRVLGGHLKDGCIVKYTAEIVIGIFENAEYRREMDENTGFKELVTE
jgi:uncharacterized protein